MQQECNSRARDQKIGCGQEIGSTAEHDILRRTHNPRPYSIQSLHPPTPNDYGSLQQIRQEGEQAVLRQKGVATMKWSSTKERNTLRHSMLVACTVSAGAMSVTPARADSVAIHRCVLVSKSLDSVFAAQPTGGLASLNLKTGATRWSSKAGELPLGLVSRDLLTQGAAKKAGVLELVTLSAEDGRTIGRQSVTLPQGVHAAVAPGPGRSFTLRAAPRAGGLRLTWHAMSTRVARGLPGVAGEENSQLLSGRIDVNMGTSAFRAAPTESKSANASTVSTTPMIREVTDFPLEDGARGRRYASADGQHILISQRREQAGFTETFEWSIYEHRSRRLLGKVNSPVPVAPFIVSGTNLVYTTPEMSFRDGNDFQQRAESLHARDMSTGAVVWSREIRSLTLKEQVPH